MSSLVAALLEEVDGHGQGVGVHKHRPGGQPEAEGGRRSAGGGRVPRSVVRGEGQRAPDGLRGEQYTTNPTAYKYSVCVIEGENCE